jgi:hypothetical protein
MGDDDRVLETCYAEHLLVDEQASALQGARASRGLPNYLAGLYLQWAEHFASAAKPSDVSIFEAAGSIPISYAKRCVSLCVVCSVACRVP